MLNPYCTLILSTLLGVSSSMFAAAGTSAETLSPADVASSDGNVLAVALIEPQKSQEPAIVWDQKTHGERCLYRSGACRLFHDGYYYETPWWGLPLAIGGIGPITY